MALSEIRNLGLGPGLLELPRSVVGDGKEQPVHVPHAALEVDADVVVVELEFDSN